VNELIAPFVPGGRPGPEHWIEPLLASELFGSVEERRFPFVQKLDAPGLADRLGSISFIAAASPERRADLDHRIRDLVEAHGGEIEFPYVTSVFVSRAE
jgi:hypothetical protein